MVDNTVKHTESEEDLMHMIISRSNSENKAEIVEVSPKGRFYRVIFNQFNDELGSGAFKVVYRGFDNDQGCEVAWNSVNLKNLPLNDRNLIAEEVKLSRRLNHPNIVHFISAWTSPSKEELIIITEIVTGGSLKQYFKKIKTPRLRVIKLWCKGILSGLLYLHSQKPFPIIHRDLKCANIFIMSNTGDVKIGDFGLSTIMQDKMKTSVLGTPEYMAPEVYKGLYDSKIDIYSFGMCIVEMCTLRSPYSECGSQAAIYKKVISQEPPAALFQIHDNEVVEFIKKCISPWEQRPSAEELLNDKFLLINEEEERLHQTVEVITSPRSNISSISSSQSHIDISLIINECGELRQISFPFCIESDTPEKVAEEMVEDLELNKEYIIPVAKEIESKLKSATQEVGMFSHENFQIRREPRAVSPEKLKLVKENSLLRELEVVEENSEVFAYAKKSSMKSIRSENDLGNIQEFSSFVCLKKGVENDKPTVKKLQLALSAFLNTSINIDGFFGNKTEALVRVFQESFKLRPDGIVNKEVWDRLMSFP